MVGRSSSHESSRSCLKSGNVASARPCASSVSTMTAHSTATPGEDLRSRSTSRPCQSFDLCPHQDYIYLSAPSEQEQHSLDEFRRNVQILLADLCADQGFIKLFVSHPWIRNPHDHIEEILSDPDYFSSMLIFLSHVQQAVSRDLLEVLGTSGQSLPPLDVEWLEVLLNGCLKRETEHDRQNGSLVREISRRLHQIGAIDHGRVTLRHPRRVESLLTGSTTKLQSVVEIVKLEAASIGADLRAVVLGDFIRKQELPRGRDEARPLEELGVVPIFEGLRRARLPNLKLGVLTGSLVILPGCCEGLV